MDSEVVSFIGKDTFYYMKKLMKLIALKETDGYSISIILFRF